MLTESKRDIGICFLLLKNLLKAHPSNLLVFFITLILFLEQILLSLTVRKGSIAVVAIFLL